MKNNFADEFDVKEEIIDKYGAINISLVCDVPLFIDPFLIFNSNKKEYQELHKSIIKYFYFLAKKAENKEMNEVEIKNWFTFKEVPNNWLGYSSNGNKGAGVSMKFGRKLCKNIKFALNNNNISKDVHFEKFMLLDEGNGKDNISDITVCLIKDFLCKYTEEFAKKYISKDKCKEIFVDKVEFNYDTETFNAKRYYLPFLTDPNEFVLLTPKDILREEEQTINRKDLFEHFDDVLKAIDNESLREEINNYITKVIRNYECETLLSNQKIISKDERKVELDAKKEIIKKYPEFYDYYVKFKENDGDDIKEKCKEETDEINDLLKNAKILSLMFKEKSNSNDIITKAKDEAIYRITKFKEIIENEEGYKLLYYRGKQISNEDKLNRLFRFTKSDSTYKFDFETNNGRGPADIVISKGKDNQCVVELKLASNKRGLNNIFKQVDCYCKANECNDYVLVIFFFSEKEENNLKSWIKKENLESRINKNIFSINCRNDDKPSASRQ